MSAIALRLSSLPRPVFTFLLQIYLLINYAQITDSTNALPKWITDLELPDELLPYHIKSKPDLRSRCERDGRCPYREFMRGNGCWGYEPGCAVNNSYSYIKSIHCTGSTAWPNVKSVDEHKAIFYEHGDFGRLKEHQKHFANICTSDSPGGSSLRCVDNLRHCTATNIYFDLSSLEARKHMKRYREGVINKGQVGGRCDKFDRNVLAERMAHKSYLQSWADELQHFESYNDFRVDKQHCDVIFNRPTVIIKLDAAVNMYHHFCDFINLYASQHMNGSFDRDIDIVWWDTHHDGFIDSMFGATWRAFSRHKPVELVSLDGKRVCFRDALLPLLARQRLGLFYNMPVVPGCSGSGLFRAFAKHIHHRLGVTQHGPLRDQLRVTLLSRSTAYRRILNEDEVVKALRAQERYVVRVVDFKPGYPFIDQVQSDLDTDMFLSMHGSGLTHALFLPDWAGVFEIYNCDDEHCYDDLSRLRGATYRTWTKPDKVFQEGPGKHPHRDEPHKKFTNYAFDVIEFLRIVSELADVIDANPELIEARRLKYYAKDEL